MNYLDFELEIGLGNGSEYPLTLIRSPAGEARALMRFPFGELELENHLKDLKIALLRNSSMHRKIISGEEKSVEDFGKALFDSLITEEVRSCYDISKNKAADQEKGLRLKLRFQSPKLAALPWEFLYDSRKEEYISLSTYTPIVRYLELPRSIEPLKITMPLSILGMVASPQDLPPLDVVLEKQRIEDSIEDLRKEGLVDLTWMEGTTWRDLQRYMRNGKWHIFHFIGHGGFDSHSDEGLIALTDEKLNKDYRTATKLGRLLADHKSLRLVLLNSCEGARSSERDIFSSTAAILVRHNIPAVLAMQYEISDKAAIEFSRAFYEALAEYLPVDTCVAEARKAVDQAMPFTMEWGTPVLYMQSKEGVLFAPMKKNKKNKKSLIRAQEVDQESEKVSAKGWTGTWITNWKIMSLNQEGKSVEGTYNYKHGRIGGNVVGNKLIGKWSEEPTYSPPDHEGDIDFTLSNDCESFEGKWRYGSTAEWSETPWWGKRTHDKNIIAKAKKESIESLESPPIIIPPGDNNNHVTIKKGVFKPDEELVVDFTASSALANDAWIGIVPSYIPHGDENENDKYDLQYQYISGRTSGKLIFIAPRMKGSYDLRMHDTDENGREIAHISFVVETKQIYENEESIKTFDVFLCHNSADKPKVEEIGNLLKERGIHPWLDEWEIPPGLPWLHELEKQIAVIKSAAVFVGEDGIGPWEKMEIYAFLSEFVNRKCPVIPVLLPNAPHEQPELPIFLRAMMWVDFRKKEPDPLAQLIWGDYRKERYELKGET